MRLSLCFGVRELRDLLRRKGKSGWSVKEEENQKGLVPERQVRIVECDELCQ